MLKLISKLREFFLEKVFFKNVLVLVGGTAVGQGLLFATSPLISRMYSPDEFGVWSLIKGLVAIFGSIVCLRYEASVVLPKDDQDASNLLAGSILIAILFSSFSLGCVVLYGEQISVITSSQKSVSLLWVVPIITLSNGIYQTSNFWSTRKKKFKYLSIATLTQVIVMLVIQIFAPLITGNSRASTLISGSIIGQFAAMLILVKLILEEDKKLITNSLSWQSIKSQLWKYKNFPLYVAPYGFLSTFQQQSVVLLLSKFATTKEVGLYGFSNSLVRLPITLISSALNQVFFPQAAQQIASGGIELLINKVLNLIAIFTTPIFCIFIFNSPIIFGILFGSQWLEAGKYASWLGLMAYVFLFTAWLDRVYDVLGKQRLALGLEVTYDILSVVGFMVSLNTWHDPVVAVAVYSIITVVYNYVWLIVTLSLAKVSTLVVWKISKLSVAIFIAFFALNYLGGIFIHDSGQLLGVNISIALAYYLIALKKQFAKN